ncbi:MAG: DUF3592 domain-containing protein [Bacteroidetes bacterium]|jgi:hypothetical protein|nr:DUF3592 domain-containing protein [Bacteroidota bacterium]
MTEIVLLIAGAFLVVFGFVRRNKRIKLLQNGVTTQGVVVSIESSQSDDGTTYRPVIKFPVGDEFVTKTPGFYTNPCPYKEGDKVKVIYDRNDADSFTLNDGPAIFIEIVIFGLGVVFLIIAAIILMVHH